MHAAIGRWWVLFGIVMLLAGTMFQGCTTGLAGRRFTPPTGIVIKDAGVIAEIRIDQVPGQAAGEPQAVLRSWRMRPDAGNVVPLELGATFGIVYEIQGEPAGTPTQVTVRYQSPGVTMPDKVKWVYIDQPKRVRFGETHWAGYTFEKEWELVPGTWSIEVYYDQERMATRTFEARPPNGKP